MGYETTCRVRVTDASGAVRDANAKVLLETDDLIVRGEARVTIPRASIQRMTTRAGVLTITAPNATVSLTLGADAAIKWRKKLEEAPKSLIDKLGVKPGARVWVIGALDDTIIQDLSSVTDRLSAGKSASGQDIVFIAVETPSDIGRVDRAAKAITDAGAIWAIRRKGPTGVAEAALYQHARALGLMDIKVARVSETHTAEKFVKPLAKRRAPTGTA